MTLGTYQNEEFDTLNVSKGTTIAECVSPTLTLNTIIIIAVCASTAAVVVVTLLVVLLFKVLTIKRKDKVLEEEAEDSEYKENNEIPNSFSIGMSITNIDEDPFADDLSL